MATMIQPWNTTVRPHPRPPVWRRWFGALSWMGALLAAAASLPVPEAVALAPQRALTQYRSRILGQEDGLPCNGVLSVVQSRDGYLWLATEEGLVRFDGVRARVINRQSDPRLTSNFVSDAIEDARHPGEILLAGASGVKRFAHGEVSAFVPDEALNGPYAKILLQDPLDGSLWVQTARNLTHARLDGSVIALPGPATGWPTEKCRAVCRDDAGCLWLGTVNGLYRELPPASGGQDSRFERLPAWADKEVECLVAARGGGLWVGSRAGGSGLLDREGIFHPRAALAGFMVTALLEDHAGTLWVGTFGNGLFRLPVNETLTAAFPGPVALTTDDGLVRNIINGLCEDREGSLWIATGVGLQVLRDVRFINYGRPEGLAGDDVRTIFEDGRGQLWVGHDKGLSLLGSGEQRPTNYPLPPSPNRPGDNHVLCGDRGDEEDTLLIGTIAGLVRWRAGQLELLPLREDLDHSKVRCLCRDRAGDRWVGTDRGLYQVRAGQVLAHLTTADGLSADPVQTLHADRWGNLWIGTFGGLDRRRPDGRIQSFLRSKDGRPLGRVDSLLENPDDADELFVGTLLGLYRLQHVNLDRVRITGYSVREGLFDDLVTTLLSDDRGNLWMSCNRGISRVSRADLGRFDRHEIAAVPYVAYGVSAGLRSRECNGGHQPAAWRDHAGRCWFATVKGAAMVDPAHVEPNPLPPPVYVEEVVADGRPVAEAQGPGRRAQLAAGTRKLDLRYTALSLTAPEANRFRYRLEGFETGWTEAGTERVAHYTNLAPGNYRFHVQAANGDGVWNTQGAAFPFHLRPFFYQNRWFQGAAAVLAVLGLWAILQRLRRGWQLRLARTEEELRERTRTQEVLRQAKEAAEHEHEVALRARSEAEEANAAKSEFLSRLSHELRTPLNAILGFGQLLAVDDLSDPQSKSLGHILGGGRHLLKLVDEILDLTRVDTGNDQAQLEEVALAPLVEEVMGLVRPLARQGGVAMEVEPTVAHHVGVLADHQRLKQVLLNLLANAIKYNRPSGGQVVAGVQGGAFRERSGPRWRVFVRDTGMGIDPAGLAKLFTPFERLGAAYGPIKGNGLGLATSKKLTEAMGGTIGVESTPGVGSVFWVELPAVEPSATLPSEVRSAPPPLAPGGHCV